MHRRLFVSIACVALLLVVAAVRFARAGDEPVRLPLAVADVPAPETDWYGVYAIADGTKIGWGRFRFEHVGEAPVSAYAADYEVDLKIKAAGRRMHMNMAGREEFDATPPFAFRAGHHVTSEDGTVKVVDLARAEGGAPGAFTATVKEGGETRRIEAPSVDYTLADSVGQTLWARGARAVGDSVTFRAFDVEDVEASRQTLTVVAAKESLVGGVRVPYIEVSAHSSRQGDMGVARVDGQGKMLSMRLGGMFELRLESEETAKKTTWGADLFVFGMVRADRAIGVPMKVTRLVLEVKGEGGEKIPGGPRQAVYRDEATGAWRLLLGGAYGGGEAATEEEVREALAETVTFPVKHPKVVRLANEAVKDAADPREKVKRLVAFVSEYVKDDLAANASSVLDVIAAKKGDCTEHSLLFAALARAAGVPARQVTGLMYMGDDAGAFGGHAWDEVVLDGRWVPVDPAWNQVETDATHVTHGRGDGDSATLATFGRISFHVVSVDRAP